MSVPQNITIQYIAQDTDFNFDEDEAETIVMSQEQQDAIESLMTIPQQQNVVGHY